MRISKLDGLRGLFSLMVVLYHFQSIYVPYFFYQNIIIRKSYTFVDFFFVLSGYVIAFNYHNMNSSNEFIVYIKKRFARLFPLLFFTVGLTFMFKIIALKFFPGTEEDSLLTLVLKFLNSILFLNSTEFIGLFGVEDLQGLNVPSWSISSEMISYTVFGIVSLFSVMKNKRILLLVVIFAAMIYSFSVGKFFTIGDNGFIRGLVSFNLGYFVWYFSRKPLIIPDNVEFLLPIGLLVIFWLLTFTEDYTNFLIGMIFIPIFFSLSIYILLYTNGYLSKFLITKPMQFLGKISYSIYLNHALIIAIIPLITFKILKLSNSIFNEFVVIFCCLSILILFSTYTYKYVEVKCGKLLRGILFKNIFDK